MLTTDEAKLGNMISMAAASLLLPFLPMLAGQILVNNLLSDIPAIGLADDAVDPELVAQPRRWHMGFILSFMIRFGALSSLFDAFTFGLLWYGFAAGPVLSATAGSSTLTVRPSPTTSSVALPATTVRPCTVAVPNALEWVILRMPAPTVVRPS